MKRSYSHFEPTDLAAVLVQVAHEREMSIEHLRAEQLLAESRRAWPGDLQELWPKWLAESAKSLGLRARPAQVSVSAALDLVEDGAVLVTNLPGEGIHVLVNFDGKQAEVLDPVTDERRNVSFRELIVKVCQAPPPEPTQDVDALWLVVEDMALSHEPGDSFHDRPVSRLFAILRPEKSDIWVVGVFAFFAGVLSLATPIAVESLVNIVSFGRLLQPLFVLSLMLFGFLAFASMMKALQTFVVEIIQRRLFARVAADLAYRLPRVTQDSLHGHYGPELVNRFFDVVTLQKIVAQLLLDGLAIVLTTGVGMAVLAFYHPWLLSFDIVLLVTVLGGVIALGSGAIRSGIDESKQKYRLASWLEDLIRCGIGFKSAGASEFAMDRANQMTVDYLKARRRHFGILFRQLLFILGLQAVAGTLLLGFGGWLVIRGQLTLGQLVAAELIVATILGSLAKLGKHIEGFYDVVASVDKLGHLFELKTEDSDGLMNIEEGRGACLKLTDVCHRSGEPALQKGLTLNFERGERIALHCGRWAGSSVLLDILYGLRCPESGHVEIENTDPRDLRLDVLRDTVALVRNVEVFEGTISENVQMARPGVSMTDVRAALHAVGLLDDVLHLPKGLDTPLNATGSPLLATQQHLLMLARAIAARPRLLLIDGVLDVLGDAQLERVCDQLQQDNSDWTVLVATNRRSLAKLFESVVNLEYETRGRSPTRFLPSAQEAEVAS